jgi:hypothetical protein
MKDNLEAKFYKDIFESAKLENRDLERISFVVDKNIENPSNTDVIDCAIFLKEVSKSKKSKKSSDGEEVTHQEIKNSKSVNDRYNLSNFIV